MVRQTKVQVPFWIKSRVRIPQIALQIANIEKVQEEKSYAYLVNEFILIFWPTHNQPTYFPYKKHDTEYVCSRYGICDVQNYYDTNMYVSFTVKYKVHGRMNILFVVIPLYLALCFKFIKCLNVLRFLICIKIVQ